MTRHVRRVGCGVLVSLRSRLREAIRDIGPLHNVRASTFEAAKSLRALNASEAIGWSCFNQELPFVCSDFDAGAAFNHRQAASRPQICEGEFVFHEEVLPLKTRLDRPIMAWHELTPYKATTADFFAEVDGSDKTVCQGPVDVVDMEEDALLEEADGGGLGEVDLL